MRQCDFFLADIFDGIYLPYGVRARNEGHFDGHLKLIAGAEIFGSDTGFILLEGGAFGALMMADERCAALHGRCAVGGKRKRKVGRGGKIGGRHVFGGESRHF